ncbi:MAG TPA: hypothetical protein VE987_05310 [Polyangiaceae bacterium]|nr:hypothetical protein [Polyangiaceae bacterium]
MKRAIVAGAVLFAGAMLAFTVVAAPPKGAKSAGEAPLVSSLGGLEANMKDLHWGMTHDEVTEAYNKPGGLFDQEYAKRLVKVQPGVAQREIEADRDNRKVNLEKSFTPFLDTPTGYDVTALKSEYTYRNEEAIQSLFREGRQRYFFYIKDHLWKIYDEIPLKADSPLGATFQDAVARLNAAMNVPGRIRTADASQGIDRTTADWQDKTTHVRAVDRSNEHLVGIVLEDKTTLAGLAMLRVNKAGDPFAIDPSIAAVTRGGVSDPNAARDPNAKVDAGSPDAGRGKRR